MSTQILCVRHGHNQGVSLTEHGVLQAHMLEGLLAKTKFDLLCHSPIAHTLQTGMIVAGDDVPTFLAHELFVHEGSIAADAILTAIGLFGWDAPPERFLKSGAGRHLRSLAKDAWDKIQGEIERTKAKCVLIVGHGLLLPVLGLHVADPRDKLLFEAMNLNHCTGFTIPIGADGCAAGRASLTTQSIEV